MHRATLREIAEGGLERGRPPVCGRVLPHPAGPRGGLQQGGDPGHHAGGRQGPRRVHQQGRVPGKSKWLGL